MGNHLSPHKANTLHHIPVHKDDVISISTRICEVRSSSLCKDLSSADEQLIMDMKRMELVNKLSIAKDNDKSSGIPTVFRWHGKGEKIYLSGSFNNWNEKILLKKSDTLYYTIVNCFPGHHSYKFLLDGEWVHDPSQPTEKNSYGTLNNWIDVVEDDLYIDLALNHDEKCSMKTSDSESVEDPHAEYGQEIPSRPDLSTGMKLSTFVPKSLPPYLNETVLNIEGDHHNDPNLLRTPLYVQINHLYASSITSGIAALSVTVRYRTKFVTTVFYKPIS